MPVTAVQLTSWLAPSIEYTNMNKALNASSPDAAGAWTGQMTKLLLVVDSLRAPVALGRNLVSVVGMLNWQAEPVTSLVE